jgi:transcriptional regulator GlxA family with amidase domain
MMIRRIAILVLPRSVATAVAALQDTLWLANACGEMLGHATPFFLVDVISEDGRPQRARGGSLVMAGRSFHNVDARHVIIVPPLMENLGEALRQQPATTSWLREQARVGATVICACDATFLRMYADLNVGMQRGRLPALAGHFQRRHGALLSGLERPINSEGERAVTGAPGPAYQFPLRVVEKYCGANVALLTTMILSHSNVGLAAMGTLDDLSARTHPCVWKALALLENSAFYRCDTAALAKHCGIGSGEFARQFCAVLGEPPGRYLCRLRVAQARGLLESSNRTVEEITRVIGYEDSRSFIRLFRQHVGFTPLAYRKRYRAEPVGSVPRDEHSGACT